MLKFSKYNPLFLILYLLVIYNPKYCNVKIKIENKELNVKGFIDSGNMICYENKSIILLNRKYINDLKLKPFFITVKTINSVRLLPIIEPDYIKIKGKKRKNILIGIIEEDNINLILNLKLMEDIWWLTIYIL